MPYSQREIKTKKFVYRSVGPQLFGIYLAVAGTVLCWGLMADSAVLHAQQVEVQQTSGVGGAVIHLTELFEQEISLIEGDSLYGQFQWIVDRFQNNPRGRIHWTIAGAIVVNAVAVFLIFLFLIIRMMRRPKRSSSEPFVDLHPQSLGPAQSMGDFGVGEVVGPAREPGSNYDVSEVIGPVREPGAGLGKDPGTGPKTEQIVDYDVSEVVGPVREAGTVPGAGKTPDTTTEQIADYDVSEVVGPVREADPGKDSASGSTTENTLKPDAGEAVGPAKESTTDSGVGRMAGPASGPPASYDVGDAVDPVDLDSEPETWRVSGSVITSYFDRGMLYDLEEALLDAVKKGKADDAAMMYLIASRAIQLNLKMYRDIVDELLKHGLRKDSDVYRHAGQIGRLISPDAFPIAEWPEPAAAFTEKSNLIASELGAVMTFGDTQTLLDMLTALVDMDDNAAVKRLIVQILVYGDLSERTEAINRAKNLIYKASLLRSK